MSIHRWRILYTLTLLFSLGIKSILFAQAPSDLMDAVKQLDQAKEMVSASWGLCVIDPLSQEIILEHQSKKRLVTASTMKAVTTATAMALLGPEFKFETRFEATGSIGKEGTLYGDLIIRGSGDPTFASKRFGKTYMVEELMAGWVNQIKAAGIHRIQGRIIADESTFSTQMVPADWAWEHLGNYYGAGSGAINIYENLYRLDIKPGGTLGSSTIVIRTMPLIPGLQFFNEVTTGPPGSGDNAYIFGSPYTYERYLRGTIPSGVNIFSIKGSIPDPALHTALELTNALKNAGVEVANSPTTLRREKQNPSYNNKQAALTITYLFTHSSPPLIEIIEQTNYHSVNIFAEAIMKQLAINEGKKGDTYSGIDILKDYWSTQGLNMKETRIRDGSGLSSNNILSTYELAYILALTYNSSYGKKFLQTLPIAGKSGTMKSVGKGTMAEGRIYAKSGYISGVRGYVGYVKTTTGKTVAFAMISNNFDGSAGLMRNRFAKLMAKMVNIR